jgi:hypothetical protein
VFHVELRQFPHLARSFNLSEAELNAKVLVPWSKGQPVKMGEREWEPARAKLTILEGPELRVDEIGMGRGWGTAMRHGQEVTERVIVAARAPAKPSGNVDASNAVAAFKDVVRAQCASAPLAIHQVLWLANSRHPEWRVSERVALAERAAWELLHEGQVKMVRRLAGDEGQADVEAAKEEWGPALLTWATWTDSGTPRWYLVAPS